MKLESLVAWSSGGVRQKTAGVVEVQDRALAQVFVVLDPSAPGDRNKAIASMVGGLLCVLPFLLGSNDSGAAALQLRRALSMPRSIFVSEGTVSKHKPMVDLTQRVCEMEGRAKGRAKQRWQWFTDTPDERQRFLEHARVRGKAHASEMATLATPGEQLRNFPRKMRLRAFLECMHRVDRRCTRVGYCQR
jgi:hypothetical protein